ncbi:MAG: hypothetical protein ABI618_09100 [Nitrospirota bacterium]
MWTSRGIVSLFFFSLFLVSCGHPFISVEVRTGGEMVYPKSNGDAPQAGCWPPMTACPGKVAAGEVVKIQEVAPLTFYRIKMGNEFRNFTKPPAEVEGVIAKGDFVEVHTSDDGTMTISKAK